MSKWFIDGFPIPTFSGPGDEIWWNRAISTDIHGILMGYEFIALVFLGLWHTKSTVKKVHSQKETGHKPKVAAVSQCFGSNCGFGSEILTDRLLGWQISYTYDFQAFNQCIQTDRYKLYHTWFSTWLRIAGLSVVSEQAVVPIWAKQNFLRWQVPDFKATSVTVIRTA